MSIDSTPHSCIRGNLLACVASSSVACLKPLAFALALTFAVDANCTESSRPRPDGSILRFVENCNDAGAGSLRAVAASAQHGDGIDLTTLSCSTISLSTGAITLRDVDVFGPGADHLTIDGAANQNRRIFNHASAGGVLRINDLTVTNGKYVSNAGLGGGCLRSNSGGVYIHDSTFSNCLVVTPSGASGNARGGAIASYGGGISLVNSTITGSKARTDHGSALGGAAYTLGDLTLQASRITNNDASASGTGALIRGGGLYVRGTMRIDHSTIDGNTSAGGGGGAVVGHRGGVLYSTISNNTSTTGASGIAFLGLDASTAQVDNSTVSGNVTQASADGLSGGLYFNNTHVQISDTTIARNSETNTQALRHGAGIVFGAGTVELSLSNTIVSGNYFHDDTTSFFASDIYAPHNIVINGGKNLVGWSRIALPADTILEQDPALGPLQDNGGPTPTHMPLPNSPAIDHGGAAHDVDQRGAPRFVGNADDIGSVESESDRIFANGFE